MGRDLEMWHPETPHSQQGHRGNTLNKLSEAWSIVLEGVFSLETVI